jgi:hypothetical protein
MRERPQPACPTRSWQTPSGKLWMEGRRGSWGPDPGRARRSIRSGGYHPAGGCPPLVQQARRHDRLQECRPRPVGPCRRPYGLRVLNKRITLSAVDYHMPRPTLLGVPPGEMGEAARQVTCGKAPATASPAKNATTSGNRTKVAKTSRTTSPFSQTSTINRGGFVR